MNKLELAKYILFLLLLLYIYLFTHLKIEKLGLAINIMIDILQSFNIHVYKC